MVNPEGEPIIYIRNDIGEEEVFSRDEAILNLHGGETYDHLDHIATKQLTKVGLVVVGFYFREMLEGFDETAQQMCDMEFPMMFRPEPTEGTIERYMDFAAREIRELPEYASKEG